MTKKQFNTLTPYAESFALARDGYYRTLWSDDIEILAGVYKELGYQVTNNERSCSRCILGMLKKLGDEYFKYESKEQAKSNNKTKTEE